jgi:RAD51-like protein 2
VIERVVEIAESMINHLRTLAENGTQEERIVANNLTLEAVLSNIIYYRVHDYVEQIALVNVLPKILRESHQRVRLIVIDSVTFHFRHDFEDMSLRSRLLNNLAQNLMFIAEQHGIAVRQYWLVMLTFVGCSYESDDYQSGR